METNSFQELFAMQRNILIVILVSSIDASIVATLSTNSKPSGVADSKIITYRFNANEETEQQCRCLQSQECHKDNQVSLPTTNNQDHCDAGYVCCKPPPLESHSITTSPTIPIGSPVFTIIPCGIQKTNSSSTIRSHYDRDAEPGEFPWMVSIYRIDKTSPNGTFLCAGSIVDPSMVLTSATCVSTSNINSLIIRIGELIVGGSQQPSQQRKVKSIHRHGNFSAQTRLHDLAVLELDEEIEYTSSIADICFPSKYQDSYDPTNCLTSGWEHNHNAPSHLRRMNIILTSREDCLQKLGLTPSSVKLSTNSSLICGLKGTLSYNSCQVTIGAPLVCVSQLNPKKFIQIGVATDSTGCVDQYNNPEFFESLLDDNNYKWFGATFNKIAFGMR